MSRLNSLGALTAGAMLALGACTPPPSATDLNPAGPPMIEQILMNEEYTGSDGQIRTFIGPQLAYGHNDDKAFDGDDGKVVTAVASPSGQTLRVIMDELLVGNSLEMIECDGRVNNLPGLAANYSRVPLGTTPDDIAKCAGTPDLIHARCIGDHVVCINETGAPQSRASGGCLVDPNRPMGVPCVAPGEATGVRDALPAPDGDGVPDTDLFIDGAVRIMCKGVGPNLVEAPIDTGTSFWEPAGDQLVPAHGGVSALGPALVLHLTKGLPTGTTCHLVFDPSVTDKDGNPVCAPPDGNVHTDCPGVGDTSLATWGVAALRLDKNGNTPDVDGATVFLGQVLSVQFNTTMDIQSLQDNITITQNGQPWPFTVVQGTGSSSLKYELRPVSPAALVAGDTYVLTIGTGVKDFGGQPLTAAIVKTFTVQ